MFDSVHLTLLVGPLPVPLPAPLPVMEALQRVEITSSLDRSGFQMTFTLGRDSPLQLALLPLGFFDPMLSRVVLIATFMGIPSVIMDGVVTRQEVQPGNEPGQSTLTITGDDLSVLMNVVKIQTPYPGITQEARINLMLAKYSAVGVVPVVMPHPVISAEVPTDHYETQRTTDLEYIKSLAEQCGYIFYVEPGPAPGSSIAYFGPKIRIPVPQPALNVNSDWDTNVDSLSFSVDGLKKKQVLMLTFDPATKKIPLTIPVPPFDPLDPPLGARPLPPSRVELAEETSRLSPTDLAKRAYSYMQQNSNPVTATGALDITNSGYILRSRLLVGVRGAGLTYDGHYFVDSVTHSIKRGEYKQNFSLSRDGLVSLTPVVMP